MNDRQAIQDALARWLLWDDQGQDAMWISHSVTDSFELRIGNHMFVGAEGLRQVAEMRRDLPRGVHMISAPVICHVGDEVRSETPYLYVVVDPDGRLNIASAGVYEDTFRREPDGWRCRSRINHRLGE